MDLIKTKPASVTEMWPSNPVIHLGQYHFDFMNLQMAHVRINHRKCSLDQCKTQKVKAVCFNSPDNMACIFYQFFKATWLLNITGERGYIFRFVRMSLVLAFV